MTDTTPERRPDMRVQLTYPRSNDGSPLTARLRIHDETAGIQVFEFEFEAGQLVELLAGGFSRPNLNQMTKIPDAIGHEQTRWTEHFPHDAEAEALAFRRSLDAQGWTVGTGTLPRSNSLAAKFTVTGRRWDGGEPGTYCRAHRRLILHAHHCYECAVGPLRDERGGTR